VSRTNYESRWSTSLPDPRGQLERPPRDPAALRAGGPRKSVAPCSPPSRLSARETRGDRLLPLLMEWLQEAWVMASIDHGLAEIRSGILLPRIPDPRVAPQLGGLLGRLQGDPPGGAEGPLRGDRRHLREGEAKRAATATGGAAGAPPARARPQEVSPSTSPRRRRRGRSTPSSARDREIRQMVDILARRRKNNPICVGEAGVGDGRRGGTRPARRRGRRPNVLKGVQILGLEHGPPQAGAGVKGEFENRLKSVIDEVKASPKPVILFNRRGAHAHRCRRSRGRWRRANL